MKAVRWNDGLAEKLEERMEIRQIELGEKQFEFSSYENWCNKAQGWFLSRGLRGQDVLCLDTKGRICDIGMQFKRAKDDDAYPVTVYLRQAANEQGQPTRADR